MALAKNTPFILPESTPRSSKLTINIAGIKVYLYGVGELSPQEAENTTILFHVHGRTRTYRDAEEFGHELLFQTKSRKSCQKGLVVATFDNRNHGSRSIDSLAIQDWNGGNPKHGQDLLSIIDGTVMDIKIVIKYLATYVDGRFNPAQFIVTGVSLGGHVAWNILSEEPGVSGAIIIVGSPNLTAMLTERLEQTSQPDKRENREEWPMALETICLGRDTAVEQISGKTILILNGSLDTLVPNKYTAAWMRNHASQNDVKYVVDEDSGHWLSFNMMEQVIEWVRKILI